MYVPTMTLALGKVRAALLHRVRLPRPRWPRRSLHSFPPPFESVFNRAATYQDRLALVDVEGTYTYSNLLASSTSLQAHIDDVLKGSTKERISFLCPNAVSYVIAQWACWLGGNVAVPLYWNLPRSVLEYYIRDSQSSLLVSTKTYADHLQPIARELDLPLVVLDEEVKKETYTASKQKTEEWKRLKHKDAQILYTSGTTGPPKGVVTTHNNLFVQASAIISAWEFSSSDAVLHTLPLHHTHGIVNALVAPMYAGSTCVMLPKFDAADVDGEWVSITSASCVRTLERNNWPYTTGTLRNDRNWDGTHKSSSRNAKTWICRQAISRCQSLSCKAKCLCRNRL